MTVIRAKQFFDLALLLRILRLARPYKKKFYEALVLAIVLALLAPLNPVLIQYTVDHCILGAQYHLLSVMTVLLFSSLLIQALLSYRFTLLAARLGQNIVYDLRTQVFTHVLSLNMRYFDRTPVGTVVTRTISDVEAVNDIFAEGIINIFSDLLMLLVILMVMLTISWPMTLVTLSVLPLLLVAVWFFKEGVRKAFIEVRNQVARLNAFLQEHLSGMQVVQLFQAEQQEMEKFRVINRDHLKAHQRSVWHYSVFFPIVEILSAAALGLLVWYGAYQILHDRSTPGTIISFILFLNLMFRPIRMLADKFNTLQMGMVAAQRVFTLLDEKSQVPDRGWRSAASIAGEVIFSHVSFSYNSSTPVLRNVSFKIPAGGSLAIVGPTGAGKTTIINLLSRFYDADEGQIFLDGIDIREYRLTSLRQVICPVLQDVFLFSGSILDNVRLFNPEISRSQVEQAARRCGMDEWIRRLPGGYDYQVHERGTSLSAGQRQLISFLRALLANPRILILDEATSAVDTYSEQLIQRAMQVLTEGRTCIFIAHRLSTIKQATQILVLDQGQVKEIGTHDELLQGNTLYRRLYELQFGYNFSPV
ncbi:MAG: ABC transporter ATP-binding protein/permease [Chitinophagales bacterium]|nr:ABC transporter ATP-binding protein/permease [Chitinophagales bacterium]MDW8428061.1 ABC transporter ATP-binding protein [Chitinophagales bacterium]